MVKKHIHKHKRPLGVSVYEAARQRLEWVFETFSTVCLSFSGGKDSTLLFHLLADVAREKGRKFNVLFIDWEVQYQCTINHVAHLKSLYTDVTDNFFWMALPLTTVNGVSQFQPEWISWEKDVPWVRMPPQDAIVDYNFFPFYYYAMKFEEFVPAFSEWLSNGTSLITLTGVRSDESLNRYLGLVSKRKRRFSSDKPWTTAFEKGQYYVGYPLYDWKFKDIWIYHSRMKKPYNPLYDLMYRAGISPGKMRICEPFGPEQRQGLWLYHVLEPETWGKVCSRVSGAASGGRYSHDDKQYFGRKIQLTKPPSYSWRKYAEFLLSSMPQNTAEHYRNKIAVYLKWYREHGYPLDIPDKQEKDTGSKDVPSWRRICKVLIRNDYWCTSLSFSPTKSNCYKAYTKRIQQKRKEWGILANDVTGN